MIDLSNKPTPMRCGPDDGSPGLRADFVERSKTNFDLLIYKVNGRKCYFKPDGTSRSAFVPNITGPWWEVGRTYMHDGSGECPLPESAKGVAWFGFSGEWVDSDNVGDNWPSNGVRAYTITELPEPKLSMADELREMSKTVRAGFDISIDLEAIADRLDAEEGDKSDD